MKLFKNRNMKKNIVLVTALIFLTLTGYSQTKHSEHTPVSVVSDNKDTLFLANSSIGVEIYESWFTYIKLVNNEVVVYTHRKRINKDPVIIIKDEEWIVSESIKRNGGEK